MFVGWFQRECQRFKVHSFLRSFVPSSATALHGVVIAIVIVIVVVIVIVAFVGGFRCCFLLHRRTWLRRTVYSSSFAACAGCVGFQCGTMMCVHAQRVEDEMWSDAA